MCCCGQPTINGQLGYKWQSGDQTHSYPVNPPELRENETLLYDEPGRCGRKLDSHSHHFRLVKESGRVLLLVRHGGGDERMELGWTTTILSVFENLSSDDRYWMFAAIHHGKTKAVRDARAEVESRWQRAAAEKRIKTRKVRGGSSYKVWIESPACQVA